MHPRFYVMSVKCLCFVCRTSSAAVPLCFSSTSSFSSRKNTLPTMQRQRCLIYRSTRTYCSEFMDTQKPNRALPLGDEYVRHIITNALLMDCFCIVLPNRALCSENPHLGQLKSLLAGLTLPVKSCSADSNADDRDGKHNYNTHNTSGTVNKLT